MNVNTNKLGERLQINSYIKRYLFNNVLIYARLLKDLILIKNPQLSGLNNFNSRVCFSQKDNWIHAIEFHLDFNCLPKDIGQKKVEVD